MPRRSGGILAQTRDLMSTKKGRKKGLADGHAGAFRPGGPRKKVPFGLNRTIDKRRFLY